jgi:hypothetical protein
VADPRRVVPDSWQIQHVGGVEGWSVSVAAGQRKRCRVWSDGKKEKRGCGVRRGDVVKELERWG